MTTLQFAVLCSIMFFFFFDSFLLSLSLLLQVGWALPCPQCSPALAMAYGGALTELAQPKRKQFRILWQLNWLLFHTHSQQTRTAASQVCRTGWGGFWRDAMALLATASHWSSSVKQSVYANVNSIPAFQSIFHALMQFKWTVTTLNFFEIVQSQTHDSTWHILTF